MGATVGFTAWRDRGERQGEGAEAGPVVEADEDEGADAGGEQAGQGDETEGRAH